MAIVFGPTKWHPSYQDILVQTASLGDPIVGGYLICRNGGVAWIVAPASTEVSRTWYCRNDAVTTAEANAACGDWFVPTCTQINNPGYCCRNYWDSSSCTRYWSGTESTSSSAWFVSMCNGGPSTDSKVYTCCVRAFRCVAY